MQDYYYAPVYFSLSTATPPLNLFLFPFVPFFIMIKDEKSLSKLNHVLLVVSYLPFLAL
jgi:hypothetical protein